VTFFPALELRASIPYGVLCGGLGITPGLMPWQMVVAICVISNIILGWLVFWILPRAMPGAMKLLGRFRISRWVEPFLDRTRGRLKPYVDKYGQLGVALFIGVPLPGSGVYSGALGAYLLGLDRKKFTLANVLGVLIAGTAVTLIVLLIRAGVDVPWVDLFVKLKKH